jgi:hypothetical protein
MTPADATGTIQFFTNGVAFDAEPLVAGTAVSTNLSTLPRGTNLIAAVYGGDSTYLPAMNTLEQVVTNHPPMVVSPVSYTVVAGLNLNIPVSGLATNWSDVDGDALAIASISPSTNGVAITNGGAFLSYASTNYVADQFTCLISDNFGGTNAEVINIVVQPQTNATPVIAQASLQPGGLTLTLNGAYNSTYILQSTTNLDSGTWTPVATNQLGITGVWQFTDTQATNTAQNFYRLELAP